jgi:hypothetical protein
MAKMRERELELLLDAFWLNMLMRHLCDLEIDHRRKLLEKINLI